MSPDKPLSRFIFHARKLPAFGRELLDIRRRGLVPKRVFANAHLIVALDIWDIAHKQWRLVIPPHDDPLALDFSAVAGLEVLLAVNSMLSEPARRDAAVQAILRCFPASLIEIDVCVPHHLRFIKTHAMGVELAAIREGGEVTTGSRVRAVPAGPPEQADDQR